MNTPFSPHSKSAQESVGIVSKSATVRQSLQLLGVTSTQNNFVGSKRSHQGLDYVPDIVPPFFLSQPL